MDNQPVAAQATAEPPATHALRYGLVFAVSVVLLSGLAAAFLPRGPALTGFGDTLQLALILVAVLLTFRNFLASRARARIFWFLMFLGALLWTGSSMVWSFYELWLKQPVPDSPIVDILVFVKIVPLTTAFAAAPHRGRSSHFRAFGLLDVSVLMIYALYLYGFGVFSYRLLPGALETYNLRFNIADAIVNQIFLIGATMALLSSQASWRTLYRWCFAVAASYGFASNLSNIAIDQGRYYTGSFYDIPLVAALAGFISVALQGRALPIKDDSPDLEPRDELPTRATFVSSQMAMVAVVSTPLMGIWLLSGTTSAALLPFRLTITLCTMFLLTLLLSVKEDFLAAGLVGSLARLSETYTSIERFKTQLSQSEKLASMGELVAEVANQIKGCMTAILEVSTRLSCRPDAESRVQSMAGKIGQYAQRTDALVDNMLHFAQETPMRHTPLEIKPLLESALQLSRSAKVPNIRVNLSQEGKCPLVRGDSSQLLQVFLQLLSNAVDALEEVGGGSVEIKIRHVDSQVVLEFLDNGPGIKQPARVFEPFYTTKEVGKGTGLGLSTCYGIVQQHDGEISCHNRPTGGAAFTIRLPLASVESPRNQAEPSAVTEGAS